MTYKMYYVKLPGGKVWETPRNPHHRLPVRLPMIKPSRLLVLILASTGSAAVPSAAQEPRLTVEYLANEGVLLSTGTSKVLIDGLFDEGLQGYATVPPVTRDSLERGLGRFGEIDLILVTHVHRDHFSAATLARHLRSNPNARVAGSTQMRDSLRLLAGWIDSARTTAIRPDPARPHVFPIDDLRLEAHGIPHPPSRNQPVEHLVWVVTIGGVRVLHAGDSSPTPAELRAAAGEGIDLLLGPGWILGGASGAERIAATRARQVAAIHLSEIDPTLPTDRATQFVRSGQLLTVR
jgi:L-ascorbate metabolism protein UlaG (beta-lactamase superfamily)